MGKAIRQVVQLTFAQADAPFFSAQRSLPSLKMCRCYAWDASSKAFRMPCHSLFVRRT